MWAIMNEENRQKSSGIVALSMCVTFIFAANAWAKERHLEQVRVALIARAAHCSTCHLDKDQTFWEDGGLNPYGLRLRALGSGDSLADRIVRLDRKKDDDDNNPATQIPLAEGEEATPNNDVDGDGVPNWVEILAESNPGDKENKPSQKRIERVEQVVSCKICHEQINVAGKIGRSANPHNDFGDILALTNDPDDNEARVEADRRRRAAERIPILKRISFNKRKKPKGDKATYWERLRLMYLPTDESAKTSEKRLKEMRKQAVLQKNRLKRDPTLGIPEDHHVLGFLEDAEELD